MKFYDFQHNSQGITGAAVILPNVLPRFLVVRGFFQQKTNWYGQNHRLTP